MILKRTRVVLYNNNNINVQTINTFSIKKKIMIYYNNNCHVNAVQCRLYGNRVH